LKRKAKGKRQTSKGKRQKAKGKSEDTVNKGLRLPFLPFAF
jgi:uncharacterized protein YjbJ (UPF0337 family)